MRNGLEAMLESEPNYEVAGVAVDGVSAVSTISESQPDIILMGLSLPRTDGIDAIEQIKRQHPHIKIVALSYHQDDKIVRATLKAGADAFVLKDDSRTELFSALENVVCGKKYLSPSIIDKVVSGYLSGGYVSVGETSRKVLTQREQEVIKLIAEGNRTKDIATCLSLSPKTVEKHRTNLMRKLDLHNVSEVTVYAIKNGYVSD
jgi:DNA-binding NarL/FixJ family response regulator